LSGDKKFGEIWTMIFEEYVITEKYLFKLTGHQQLMEEYPVEQLSVSMREKIVLPSLTIQQYALLQIRKMEEEQQPADLKETFEKLVTRCSFGIINAGRNSA
jgi:phosphoenolpyruvate carboxylase